VNDNDLVRQSLIIFGLLLLAMIIAVIVMSRPCA